MERFKTHLKTGESSQMPAALAVNGILKMLKFDPSLFAVFEIWDRETRPLIKGCEAIAICGSRLVVTVPSPMHRQEIMYSKDRILARVNQAMGRRAITDIQFEFSRHGGQAKGELSGKDKIKSGFERN